MIQVLVNKKGIKAITSSELFSSLALPKSKYRVTMAEWLKSLYNLQGEIRRPQAGLDYSQKKDSEGKLLGSVYFSIPLAIQIAVRVNNNRSKAVASFLLNHQAPENREVIITAEEAALCLALARKHRYLSEQIKTEREHESKFQGDHHSFIRFRLALLGVNMPALQLQATLNGKNASGKSWRQLMMLQDEKELIRISAMEALHLLEYPKEKLNQLGDLVKTFATQLELGVIDDRKLQAQPNLLSELYSKTA